MSLTVTDKGGGFEELATGSYLARCVRIIDLGTQDGEYEGKKSTKVQVLIMWELPTEIIEDGDYAGKPRTIGKFYTASLNEKATLRLHLEAWRGQKFTEEELTGFSLNNILGKPCMLSIVHSKAGKAKVGSVSKVLKGMECPPQILPSQSFDLSLWLEGNQAQRQIYDELTDGIKALINRSHEAEDSDGGQGVSSDPDEIPF